MSDIPFPTKSIKNSPLRNSLLKGKNYRCCVRLFSPHSNLPLYTVIFHITSTGHIISGNSFYPDQENFKALRWSHILCLVTRGYLGLMALTFNLLCLVSDVLNKYHDSCSSFQRGFYKWFPAWSNVAMGRIWGWRPERILTQFNLLDKGWVLYVYSL